MAVTMITMSLIIIALLVTVAIMEEQIARYRRAYKQSKARQEAAERAHNRLQIAHNMSNDIASQTAENERKTRLELLERVRSLEDALNKKNAEIIHLKARKGKKGEDQ